MGKGCVNCLRILVFVVNVLFFLVGAAILGFALFLYFDSTMQAVKDQASMKMKVDILLFVSMGIGGLTALVSMFGCCGAYHESGCMLATYFVLLLVIAGLEMAAGVFLYINRADGTVRDSLTVSISASIENRNATTLPEHIRRLQQFLGCCGANGTEYSSEMAKEVCVKDGKQFTEGCAVKAARLLDSNAQWLLIAVSIVAGLEVVAMLVALYLCCVAGRDEEGYVGVSAD